MSPTFTMWTQHEPTTCVSDMATLPATALALGGTRQAVLSGAAQSPATPAASAAAHVQPSLKNGAT